MFLPLNIYMVVASQLLGVAADQVPTYDFGQNCHSIALVTAGHTNVRRRARARSEWSISTVILPSYSVRVIRRVSCSQVTRRPWRSRRLPLAWLEGSR